MDPLAVNAGEMVDDIVRFGEAGWKERYYYAKFAVELGDWAFTKAITTAYIQGLCWVLLYYYRGCPDWAFYYPYHYAPFASDFTRIGSLTLSFAVDSQPLTPLEQLMGVLPPASAKVVEVF